MSNYKNLKKVIAVSSMAAATIGAGTMVNADNVHQQPGSSQKTNITAKSSSEAQSVKSGNTVVLKSSQSSKSAASSSKAASSSSKQTQPMNLAATVTPSITAAQHDTVQNDINSISNVINKYQSDNSMAVSTVSSNFGTDLVTDALNDYTSGLATKEELQKDVQKVQGVLNDDKGALAKETNAHAKEILQAQVKLDQDAYNLLSQAVNDNASQVSSSKASTSSKKDDTKASSSSKASTSSKKDDTKASSSSKASTSSKKDDTKASSSSSYPNGGTTAGPAKISDKQAAELQWAYGMDPLTDQPLKDESPAQQQKAKAYLDALKAGKSVDEAKKEATKSSNVKNSVKPVAKKAVVHKTAATVSSKKATKRAAVRSTKKASMPQTGEANNAGILAGIGALAIAAAGAFLFRKRG